MTRLPPETDSIRLPLGYQKPEVHPKDAQALLRWQFAIRLAGGGLDRVVPGDVEGVPCVADRVDRHVQAEAAGADRIDLRSGRNIGVDRIEVVAGVIADAAVKAGLGRERLVLGVLEPRQEKVLGPERVDPTEEVGPSSRRQGQQAGEEAIGERGEEGLSALARLRDPRELERFQRRLAGSERRVIFGNRDRTRHLEDLVDGERRDRQDAVDPVVAGFVRVESDGVFGARGKSGDQFASASCHGCLGPRR